MRRSFSLLALATMLFGLVAAPAPASALSNDPCGDAADGIYPRGYEVVWGGNGGPGNQIILGDDGDNTLKGGTGNDTLANGETNRGGSGNNEEITIIVIGAGCALAQSYDYPDSTPDLYYKDLRNCDLSGADLSNSYLDGSNLTGANLFGANLSGAYAYSTIWNNTTCPDGSNSDDDDGDDFTCSNNR